MGFWSGIFPALSRQFPGGPNWSKTSENTRFDFWVRHFPGSFPAKIRQNQKYKQLITKSKEHNQLITTNYLFVFLISGNSQFVFLNLPKSCRKNAGPGNKIMFPEVLDHRGTAGKLPDRKTKSCLPKNRKTQTIKPLIPTIRGTNHQHFMNGFYRYVDTTAKCNIVQAFNLCRTT